MARPQVRELREAAQIVGVASPVNTYVRPGDPAPSPLHGIAEGLASLHQGISGVMGKRQKEAEDADKVRAEALFNSNNQIGWAEAVKTGAVPANASPIFMRAYKESEGALAGVQLKQKWQEAYSTWEGRSANDPVAFKKFYRDFVAANIQTTDVDVLRGLNPYVASLTQESYGQYGTESANAVYEGNKRTNQALVNSSIDAANASGEAEGATDYEALWENILERRKKAVESGTRDADFDALIIQSITTKAEELGDEDLLKLLDRKMPGSDVKLSDLQAGVDAKNAAERSISTVRRQAIADAEKAQEKSDKAQELALKGAVTRKLAADPNADVTEEMDQIIKYDPEFRIKLNEVRKSVQDVVVEDRGTINDMMVKVASGEMDMDDIFAAARSGKVGSSLTTLLDRAEKYQTDRAKGGGLYDSRTAKTFRDAITNRLAPQGPEFLRSIDGSPLNMTDEMLEASSQFDIALLEWEEANPNASVIERDKAIREIGNTIMENITADDPANPQFDSTRDKQTRALEEQQKTGDLKMEQQSETPQEPQYSVSEESVRKLYDVEGEPPAMDTLPESYRQQLEKDATENGIDAETLNRKTWEYYRKELYGEEPLSTLRPEEDLVVPPEQGDYGLGDIIDGAYDTANLVNDGAEAPILNLISSAEGSTDYNTSLGFGKFLGGERDLTSMSLKDILDTQGEILSHPENDLNSSAVGKYQIVRKTLRGLIDTMGLSLDDKFTPELQDRMALQLLEGRGLSKWRSGELSDQEFLKGLGDEWQSFAKGKASRSAIISALNRGQGPQGGGLADLVSSNKRGYTPDLENLKQELASGVSTLQEAWGKPLPIVSGFRDPERNRKAGGAKHSQHQSGNAVDIDVSDLPVAERVALIKLASEQGFTGIGVYANSLHLDYGKRRAWGPTHHDDSIPKWAKAAIAEHSKRT